ncbi:GGDEF-domain containing protein, partial [[Eubacterium] siraeum]|nr:GGDEF-domain containing protein [[Eubacterium] siraeum]
KKHNIKLSELKKVAPGLADVLDVDYLTSIQRPFAVPQLYSAIFDVKGKLICAPKTQHKSLSPDDFAYQKKMNIRINHLVSGTWILGAKTQELLDDNIQLWETLVQTVSRMANAFVVVLSEMDNSQNANKLLGQNVEEQILLNNICAFALHYDSVDIIQQYL